ncbi:MAG TPA: TIGR00282 family metallophosphoesterase [Armatimonadota bacterium]|nr:TIGR00282 family metallophosphoesterase [Armatimonadota bacterium]
MRILFFGDIVGRPGRQAVTDVMPRWRSIYQPDIVVANGENAAAGVGITPSVAEDLFGAGIDVITLGNHTFKKKEAVQLLEDDARVLRPANYPPEVPGYGYGIFRAGEARLAVVSLLGRVFLDPLDDPFHYINTQIPLLRERTPCILIDMHAEATSEKAAIAWMVDGKASAVVGTHTHVATADERVLPNGTAFITDVGMVGPRDAILGVKREPVIDRFLTRMPVRFEVAGGPVLVNAVLITVDESTGAAEQITRLQEVLYLD